MTWGVSETLVFGLHGCLFIAFPVVSGVSAGIIYRCWHVRQVNRFHLLRPYATQSVRCCVIWISGEDQGPDVRLSTLLQFIAPAVIGQEVKALQLERLCFAPALCGLCPPGGPDISVMDTLIVADWKHSRAGGVRDGCWKAGSFCVTRCRHLADQFESATSGVEEAQLVRSTTHLEGQTAHAWHLDSVRWQGFVSVTVQKQLLVCPFTWRFTSYSWWLWVSAPSKMH